MLFDPAQENGTTVASFTYDPFEQRVSKAAGGAAIHFIHDQFGRLLAEHDGATGAALREYVYLGLMPVLMVDHSSGTPIPYWIHTDQVMQPVKMTDGSGTVVWDRVATPFGVEVQTTGALTQRVRFPGQVEDLETAFHQNWHRDYDPTLGRYVQSDPIGLMGGINTYAYVEGNPLIYTDPTGECPWCFGFALGVGLEFLTNPCASAKDLLIAGGIGALGGVASKAAFLKYGPKARTRDIGKEWSHSIPKRFSDRIPSRSARRAMNRRGGLNGSWASPKRHFKHDPYRYPKGHQQFGDRFSKPLQLFDRIPDWLKGTVGGAGVGAGAAGNGSCGCSSESSPEEDGSV